MLPLLLVKQDLANMVMVAPTAADRVLNQQLFAPSVKLFESIGRERLFEVQGGGGSMAL